MSIVNTIRGALDTHLATMVGVPTIHPANTMYDPDPKTAFLKTNTVVVNIEPAVRGLNPQLRYSGFFTILICTPEGNGLGDSLELAEDILDRFAPTTDISHSGIILSIEDCRMSPDYYSAPFNCLPVTINWYIYHSN